ncbi:MAG: 2-succinyl-5-enolpyruvyl-6-hydroxy-3-cyclohexene-1-carboxylic-acid synthase [Cyanobacteria bacterium QS_8_64_29]|nr:MAG: 2-succinyl-5-enolpyruvyl-6-hydroxy-3-cyclohexene-1-carboxylic-acid synthase [Cyanobacteria bacterium QS_8_64_29]
MQLDGRNANTLWASVAAETLWRAGVTVVIVCPGSRSGPLAVAFAQHPHIEAIPILDERSAAFFALGWAKRARRPAVLVCTSGTAGAHFYPAAIEASESQVPLLALTADRPPELRHCHAGQAIDQQKLYGAYPRWQAELALPGTDSALLRYLRQTLLQAVRRSLLPVPGVVHLNVPFREPLAPVPADPPLEDLPNPDTFFSGVAPPPRSVAEPEPALPMERWQRCERGLIIAGVAQPPDPQAYSAAIARLARALGWVVLAEGLSPLRNHAGHQPELVSTYDSILRQPQWARDLAPAMVIQAGALPTSKVLRQWMSDAQPQRWVVDPSADNFDPLHGHSEHFPISIERLAAAVAERAPAPAATEPSPYSRQWQQAEAHCRQQLDRALAATETLFEGKVAWLLAQSLPPATPLLVANSTPVRDVEWFWPPNARGIRPFCNRGANGIDGTLSTALGLAHRQLPSALLTGDLALLHDTNGWLQRNRWVGHLTVVAIANGGGGIFEGLPIAGFEPPFEDYFATPQPVALADLCAAYGVVHERIASWQRLQEALNPLPETGLRVLEVPTDRQADARYRQALLEAAAPPANDDL